MIESVKILVGFDGGDFRVVVVVFGVGSIVLVFGNSIIEENVEDMVGGVVGVVFIESDEDKGVFYEVFVFKEGFEEVMSLGISNGNRGVVVIVGYVGGDEDLLGESFLFEVGVEYG